MDLLNSDPVVELSGDEFLPKEGKTFIQQVLEYFELQGGQANSPFGVVILDKKGIKNDIGHGIGRLKSASFAAIKDVLEKGVIINPMKQYHTNDKENPTGMIAAPITIGGEKYVCVVEVIANRKINRLYVHEVTLTKNLQGVVADSNAVHGDNNPVTQPQGEIAKIPQKYISDDNNKENNQQTKENKTMKKKQTIRLNESQLHRIIKESVKKVLKENNNDLDDMSNDGEYPYYVAADVNSDYFKTFREAYNYALRLARKEKDWYDDILLMDNEQWQTILVFREDGIYDYQNGTHKQYPW